MFLRESEGVYEFGSRRVMVKVERDKIQIKVGGGYLSIDEFLDQYTPAELEKLERRDPLKRFTERVAVQKVIASQGGKESSPVRPQTSPTKSSSTKKKRQAQWTINNKNWNEIQQRWTKEAFKQVDLSRCKEIITRLRYNSERILFIITLSITIFF